jgi:hypothetical protein
MRQITRQIVTAFEQRRALKIDNSETDGTSLWLFGNKIAEYREGGIWITNAGWSSVTTKERLNGLTGVHITQKKGEWYLNGNFWQGEWTSVNENNGIVSTPLEEVQFDITSKWIASGKYSVPNYSVFHTHIEEEVEKVEYLLMIMGIPTKKMYSDTDGEYKPNHFVVVPITEFDKACEFMKKVKTESI